MTIARFLKIWMAAFTWIFLFLSAPAFAQVPVINNANPEFLNEVTTLLGKNVDKLNLTGDVHPGEKLRPILQELADYITALVAQDEEFKSNIKDIRFACDVRKSQAFARCDLSISYHPMGETALLFDVTINKESLPETIMGSRIEVSRGD